MQQGRHGGLLVTASLNGSGNVNVLIHIKIEEESKQEGPRVSKPD